MLENLHIQDCTEGYKFQHLEIDSDNSKKEYKMEIFKYFNHPGTEINFKVLLPKLQGLVDL